MDALHPDFGIYVVLLATVQNAVFNPICFVLAETGQACIELSRGNCCVLPTCVAARHALLNRVVYRQACATDSMCATTRECEKECGSYQ